MTAKMMQARFASRCTLCGAQIRAGQWITWSREQGAHCTTPTTTVGVTGQTFYGHKAEHPAIQAPAPKAPSAAARWCRSCNDWEHNSCSGECRMYASR
jgi:hypothetical protein